MLCTMPRWATDEGVRRAMAEWRILGSPLSDMVARTIAREHGGDVTLCNRASGGLSARVELPG